MLSQLCCNIACGGGHNMVLTYQRNTSQHKRKRAQAVKRCQPCRRKCGAEFSKYECDEFPFASTTNPTRHVMEVLRKQNKSHAGFLGNFYKKCKTQLQKNPRWESISTNFLFFS